MKDFEFGSRTSVAGLVRLHLSEDERTGAEIQFVSHAIKCESYATVQLHATALLVCSTFSHFRSGYT